MIKYLVLLSLLAVLGGLYYYSIFVKVDISEEPQSKDIERDPSLMEIKAQAPGNYVFIDSISLKDGGYIVIRENLNISSSIEIIGNSRSLSSGESKNIFIGLTRSTKNGDRLFAVLYTDNGDEAFYPSIDIPAKDEYGDPIFTEFYVDANVPKIDVVNP